MFGASIGRAGQRIIDAMVRWLAHGHISPNILTIIGVAINVGSGLLFGYGRFFWAGIVFIGALSTRPGSHNFFANRMPAVLWVLAIGSYWTFAHRMYHTWREVTKTEISQAANAKTANQNAGADLRREPTLAHKPG